MKIIVYVIFFYEKISLNAEAVVYETEEITENSSYALFKELNWGFDGFIEVNLNFSLLSIILFELSTTRFIIFL